MSDTKTPARRILDSTIELSVAMALHMLRIEDIQKEERDLAVEAAVVQHGLEIANVTKRYTEALAYLHKIAKRGKKR